jgi:hypothetical protein
VNVSKELVIMTPEKFSELLDHRLSSGMRYIDAIVDICEKTGIEIETVPKLMTPKIRKRIKSEAESLNMLKRKGARLPVG